MNIIILCANKEDGRNEVRQLFRGIKSKHNFVLIYKLEQLDNIEVNAISTTMRFWNENRRAQEIFMKAENQLKDVI